MRPCKAHGWRSTWARPRLALEATPAPSVALQGFARGGHTPLGPLSQTPGSSHGRCPTHTHTHTSTHSVNCAVWLHPRSAFQPQLLTACVGCLGKPFRAINTKEISRTHPRKACHGPKCQKKTAPSPLPLHLPTYLTKIHLFINGELCLTWFHHH